MARKRERDDDDDDEEEEDLRQLKRRVRLLREKVAVSASGSREKSSESTEETHHHEVVTLQSPRSTLSPVNDLVKEEPNRQTTHKTMNMSILSSHQQSVSITMIMRNVIL